MQQIQVKHFFLSDRCLVSKILDISCFDEVLICKIVELIDIVLIDIVLIDIVLIDIVLMMSNREVV